MTTAAVATAEHKILPLKSLSESPLNPRKTFDKDKLKELAESIAKHGVLQPVLARPMGKGYELVFGHRRYRAAVLAGRTEIPAMVRAMDDKTVLEEQCIENVQREDVPPMEEAAGYKRLVDDHGYKVPELAAKVGKSASYVWKRLKLAELAKPIQAALLKGEISVAVAELLGRVPGPLQEKALESVVEWNGEPKSYEEAAETIRDEFMLDLAHAPFDTNDRHLVAAAGACASCPKRTGNQKELFSDVKKGDTCTDPTCFALKKNVAWKLKAAQVKDVGGKMLTAKEAEQAFDAYGTSSQLRYNAKWVKVTDKCEADPKKRTYAQLLGKTAPLYVAKAPNGAEVKLLPKADLAQLIKDAGHKFKAKVDSPRPGYNSADYAKQQKAEEEKRALRAGVINLVAADISARAEENHLGEEDLRFIVANILRMDNRGNGAIERRAGIVRGEGYASEDRKTKAFVKSVETMPEAQLQGLLYEIAFQHFAGGGWSGYSAEFKRFCEQNKFDLKKLEDQVKAGAKTEEKKPAAAGDIPKCVACGCTEDHACEGGCSWVEGARYEGKAVDYLCSACDAAPEGDEDEGKE